MPSCRNLVCYQSDQGTAGADLPAARVSRGISRRVPRRGHLAATIACWELEFLPRSFARIHVLLASEAPLGVVIRRGPSKHVCTIGWERSRDEFQLGQWLNGRIYERRSDLSPDGKHLIYFAMNGKWSAEARGS